MFWSCFRAPAAAPGPDPVPELEPDRECWICMDAGSEALISPCSCPSRRVHEPCMARWQLQSAGKREETRCRFCGDSLPDWTKVLTPAHVALPDEIEMQVTHGARTMNVVVRPGSQGLEDFTRDIRRLFSMPDSYVFEFTFSCNLPPVTAQEAGGDLTLQGLGAFEAAFHCAAVTKALRVAA